MHRDNWNGKILCLKRWISLQKCLWCAIYWWVIHRQVIDIKIIGMCRRVWIYGVMRNKKVISLVPQGTQIRLKGQNTVFKTLNFVTKVFMMRHLLMSNCLFGMCCRAWICGVTRKKNVVSLVLQGAPSRLKRQMNKFFEWRIITQAVRTASYHILFNAPHCIIPFLKLTHKAVRILWYAGFSSSGYQRNLHKACEHEVSINRRYATQRFRSLHSRWIKFQQNLHKVV